MLITAGIHNAEYVGIQAAIELSRELNSEDICGTAIILPLVNRSGFEHRTMSTVYEDGKNLNRVFPGNACGSVAERIAHMVFTQFILNADYYIDLHSGDGFEALTPYVYYLGDCSAETQSRQMACCVNVPYRVRSSCQTGGAYNLASMNGIPSILIERGQMGTWSRTEVDACKNDICNILKMLQMLPGESIIYPGRELLEHSIHAPKTGCWYPMLHPGSVFQKGDFLGEIRDYFGNLLYTSYAPEDGILLYQCASLNIIEKGPMLTYGTLC